MSDFDPITWAFEVWFDKPLYELPESLRERANKEFFPFGWEGLSADQRRSLALQLDYQHDPATAQDQQFWWDFFEREDSIKKQILQWESATCHSAGDLSQKEARLKELRQQINRMELQQRLARGDYYPERPQREGKDEEPAGSGVSISYIAYPKAMKSLSNRLKATPEELAAWVWMEPKNGGLAAYLNANELDPPPRFGFTLGNEGDFDYLAPLMACWFSEEDIGNFEPADRFITGSALIERWNAQPDLHAEAFIRAKITESRLLDAHPIYGATQGTYPEDSAFPPLASGLFVLAHVEQIEAEDFGTLHPDNEYKPKQKGHLNHDPEMQLRANAIAASQKDPPTRNKVAKLLAQELGMDEGTVLRRIRKGW